MYIVDNFKVFIHNLHMENKKNEIISLRIKPELKQLLEKIAKDEFRPLSFQVEKIILEWLEDRKLLPKSTKNKR